MNDADREAMIEAARVSMTHALTAGCQRFWFGRMKELINGRSTEQIEQMERARGLRTS